MLILGKAWENSLSQPLIVFFWKEHMLSPGKKKKLSALTFLSLLFPLFTVISLI